MILTSQVLDRGYLAAGQPPGYGEHQELKRVRHGEGYQNAPPSIEPVASPHGQHYEGAQRRRSAEVGSNA